MVGEMQKSLEILCEELGVPLQRNLGNDGLIQKLDDNTAKVWVCSNVVKS